MTAFIRHDESQEILFELLSNINTNCNIAVEALIFNKKGEWVLHKRGPMCRDERYRFENIGGSVNIGENFKDAMKREIVEELGFEAEIVVGDIYGIRKSISYNDIKQTCEEWFVISYVCYHAHGALEVVEPDKNLGFLNLHINDINISELSTSTVFIYEQIKKNWGEIEKYIIRELVPNCKNI